MGWGKQAASSPWNNGCRPLLILRPAVGQHSMWLWGKRALSVSLYHRRASLTAGWNLSLHPERKGQWGKATLAKTLPCSGVLPLPVCTQHPSAADGYVPSLFLARPWILHVWDTVTSGKPHEDGDQWPLQIEMWGSSSIYPSIPPSNQPLSTKNLQVLDTLVRGVINKTQVLSCDQEADTVRGEMAELKGDHKAIWCQ